VLIYVAIAAGLIATYMLAVTLRPLVDKAVVTADDWQRLEDDSMNILLRRDRIIDELRDLEFEAALDKVDQRDLDVLRRRYEGEALRLMGEIEEHVGAYDERISADVQEAIERARHRRAARVAKKAVAKVAASAAPKPDVAGVEKGETTAAPEAEPAPASVSERAEEMSPAAEPSDDSGGPAVAPSDDIQGDDEAPASSDAAPVEGDEAPASGDAAAASDDDAVAVSVRRDWIRDLPCEQCGTVVSVGSAFCDGCGATVVRACESCGGRNRLAAGFCRTCGESLAEVIS
jgi:hypothetical protein